VLSSNEKNHFQIGLLSYSETPIIVFLLVASGKRELHLPILDSSFLAPLFYLLLL